jgi:adenosylhomocysteinase
MRARGMGAHVIVTEVDPTAERSRPVMDGFRGHADGGSGQGRPRSPVTATGDKSASSTQRHMELLKDGAILSNSGHFDVEIYLKALEKMSIKITRGARFFSTNTA